MRQTDHRYRYSLLRRVARGDGIDAIHDDKRHDEQQQAYTVAITEWVVRGGEVGIVLAD